MLVLFVKLIKLLEYACGFEQFFKNKKVIMNRISSVALFFFFSVSMSFSQAYDIVYHQSKAYRIGSSNLGPEMEKKIKKKIPSHRKCKTGS